MSEWKIGQRTALAKFDASPTLALRVTSLLCIVLATLGCSDGRKPGTARLQGSITIDGQPPPAGTIGSISFRPKGTGQPTSAQIVDGKYKCDDVPIGDVDVYFQLVQETGKMVSEGGRSYPELRNLVSSKYDTGVQLKVTDDNSNQNFELTGSANNNN